MRNKQVYKECIEEKIEIMIKNGCSLSEILKSNNNFSEENLLNLVFQPVNLNIFNFLQILSLKN